MTKIITWVDFQGRYRVTSPAYDDLARFWGFDEASAIEWTWKKVLEAGGYGIPAHHPHHLVEDVVQRAKIQQNGGVYFRWGALTGQGVDGAWEMDVDGTPVVNMVKARVIHTDKIRIFCEARGHTVPDFDVSVFSTPIALKNSWPQGLSRP